VRVYMRGVKKKVQVRKYVILPVVRR